MSSGMHKKIKVGIMSKEAFKARTIAIAHGKKIERNAPKIWFHSIKSLANVLSEKNQELLKLIIERQPRSIFELEGLTGRKSNNLLRTLRTMEHYGFVKLEETKNNITNRGRRALIPKVLFDIADIEIKLA